MNWLLKTLGYRDSEYRAGNLHVRIRTIAREVVSVIHTRQEISLNLDGQRIGRKWEGIEVHVPQDVGVEKASQIAFDLEAAFQSMGYGYVICRLAGVDIVPETEREAAIAELREMGWEIEVSPDRKQISQKRISEAPHLNTETARKQAQRMMSLMQAVHGSRQRFQILTKSKGF